MQKTNAQIFPKPSAGLPKSQRDKSLKDLSQSCYYTQKYSCLTEDELRSLAESIETSSYLAKSQLSESFQSSRGFSVVFTRSGLKQVIAHFPNFEPYFQKALKTNCNAFYLNPLILFAGGQVESHIDCSISSYGLVMTVPKIVSVLYICVPTDMVGGELVLQAGDRPVVTLSPQANMLLHFLGSLTHSVTPVETGTCRISLVCEQYILTKDRLHQIPEFEIISGATMVSL